MILPESNHKKGEQIMISCKFFTQIVKSKETKKGTDYSAFLSGMPSTHKQQLIDECKKRDVSIYIDNPSEHSRSVYAIFRGVASEAELDHRLNNKNGTIHSKRANIIAILALLVSIVSCVKLFF